MTTRTSPPSRRSTGASGVSQSCAACHQRRITSSLVQASNTAPAGAWNVRCIRSVVSSLTWAPASRGVRVVVVPPLVRRRLRPAVRRVLPLLLAPERGDVEVAPGRAHRLIAARVDEVGAEDAVALADEGVVPVPLVDPEVPVEVVGDRVPGNVLPAHALLEPLDLGL